VTTLHQAKEPGENSSAFGVRRSAMKPRVRRSVFAFGDETLEFGVRVSAFGDETLEFAFGVRRSAMKP